MALSVTEFIDHLKELFESGSSLDEIKEKFGSLSTEIEGIGDIAEAAARKASKFGKSISSGIEEGSVAGKKILGLYRDITLSMKEAGYSAEGLGISMLALAPKVITGLRPFETLGDISSDASKVTAQMGDLTDKLAKAGMLPGPLAYAADLIKVGEAAKNMENQMIMNMAAAGQLDDMMGSMGGTFEGMSRKVLQFSDLTADIGSAMGLTAKQTAGLANEFMKVPDIFDQTVKAGQGAEEEFHMLDAAIRVARGTGQDYADVQEDIITMTQKFGATVQDSVETISRMYSATQSIGLSMQDMRRYVKDTGEQFKFFGDNSSAALDIMARFGPALKDSGLGPAAVTQIVQGFTTGVAQMDVAQSAFLASQTGIGGGGLRGGLEIEQMLAEGKADEVAQKVEEAIKRLSGGKIMSRKEAIAGGPGASAQFEFQRSLLQQGPFGKLAGSKQEAAKLLEALASGDRGALKDKLAGGSEALEATMERGTDLAKSQNDILIKGNNELSKIANWQSVTAEQARRTAVGVEGLLAGPAFASNLQVASKGLSQSKLVTGEGITGGPSPAEFAENLVTSVSSEIGVLNNLLRKGLSRVGIEMPTPTVPGIEQLPEVPEQPIQPGQPEPTPTIPILPPALGATGAPTIPLLPAEVVAVGVNEQAVATAQAAEQGQEQQGQRGQQSANEITIRVVTGMSEKEVVKVITLSLDEFGNLLKDNAFHDTMTGVSI
ncbi:hypothetical protein LCGC14_0523030 [marine sediment metagenome]|uniref:Phage tail tape measure protein domain-containing protein n=1 Tax=marine sediment metagenome TaxID=412755 RepID=A0A0F9SGA0_9ZZZZ